MIRFAAILLAGATLAACSAAESRDVTSDPAVILCEALERSHYPGFELRDAQVNGTDVIITFIASGGGESATARRACRFVDLEFAFGYQLPELPESIEGMDEEERQRLMVRMDRMERELVVLERLGWIVPAHETELSGD